jgi:hypothetical protein
MTMRNDGFRSGDCQARFCCGGGWGRVSQEDGKATVCLVNFGVKRFPGLVVVEYSDFGKYDAQVVII